jgi:hypothetical protein
MPLIMAASWVMLGWLAKRKLLAVAREHITAVPVYTVLRPWRR